MNSIIELFRVIVILIYKNMSSILLLCSSILVLRYIAITYSFDLMTLWLAIMLFIMSWSVENSKKGGK